MRLLLQLSYESYELYENKSDVNVIMYFYILSNIHLFINIIILLGRKHAIKHGMSNETWRNLEKIYKNKIYILKYYNCLLIE